MSEPVKFSSKLSTILVAAGCSVGLGNIWRFPYVAGENGGGAFFLIYLISILIIGFPIMMSELAMGRATNLSAMGALRKLGGNWKWLGFNGVLSAFLIMGFYYVVAGWTAEYFVYAIDGTLTSLQTPQDYKDLFAAFVSNPWRPIIFTWGFVAVTHIIIYMGVQKGLERVSNILMPMLFIILIVLAINSLMLPGSWEGVKFFLYPDFSKVTGQTILQAVGQSFFSLSIGLGALIAYGAYIPREASLRQTTFMVMALDTAVAVLAGLIIFPACFSVGVNPEAGPPLVFETLPAIFNSLPYSDVLATIFFLLLIIAALTSTMSLHEVTTVFFMEEFKFSRKKGAALTSLLVMMLGTAAAIPFTIKFMGAESSLFGLLDQLTANIMLPFGGILTSIFVGWRMGKKTFVDQVTNFGERPCLYIKPLVIILKYVAPTVIFIIFLNSVGILKI